MKCLDCRIEMSKSEETIAYDECGLEGITLEGVTVHRCPNCGGRTVGIRRIEGLHRTIAESLALRPERLGPAEFRFLRKYLGLSTADFARMMHLDPSTVSRIENKEKPQAIGDSLEQLLRMLVLTGKPVESYPLEEMGSKDRPARVSRTRYVAAADGWRAHA